MFVRAKKSGRYEYLQVVQNERVDGRVRQQAVATLGRVDQLQEQGHIDALLSSCSRFFRSLKSIMENRPIYHKCDETIRGHVFCSVLALVLFQELQLRLVERSWSVEWARLKDDLDALKDVTIECSGQPFIIRSQTRGDAGKALQAAGIALGPAVRAAQNNHVRA